MPKWLDLTDPKTQTYAAAVVAVLAAVAQGTIQLPLGIPDQAIAMIRSWDNFIVSIWVIGVVPVVMGKSTGPGPWAGKVN